MSNMLKIFKVGDEIGDYCNGFFGRDDYEDKTCVFVTAKYAVFEREDGSGAILNHSDFLEKCLLKSGELGDNWISQSKPQLKIYRLAKSILESDRTWKQKYDMIFSESISKQVNFEWYDPDTDYQEDVEAFMSGFEEHIKRIEE